MKKLSETRHGNLIVTVYEAEETKEFEVGKWYKNDTSIALFSKNCSGVGFDISLNWSDDIFMSYSTLWQPADMEEVKKLMIAEAERRYTKGTQYKSIKYAGIGPVKHDNVSALIKDGELRVYVGQDTVYFDSKGWAEIVEPLFVNSLGEKFYEYGCRVNKENYRIIEDLINSVQKHALSGSEHYTEFMTKQSAEEWVKRNRKFESGAYYKAVYNGKDTVVMHQQSGQFWMFLQSSTVYISDFDSIGEKIKF